MTDTIPAVGIHRTEDHRYYFNGQGPLPGVTTAIKSLDKSDALVGWAKKETASFAVRNLDALVAHRGHNTPVPECSPCAANAARRTPLDRQEAARVWVSSIPDYIKDSAADLGTRVHAVAEAMGRGEVPDDAADLVPFGAQYRRFMADYLPQFHAIEYKGINLTHGYGGTGDIIATLGTDLVQFGPGAWAIDIKTHTKDTPLPRTYYPETAMQLAACSRFDFIGRPGDPTEYAVPRVDAHAVLLIGRDDYRLIPYAVTDTTFDAFLHCLALHRWRNGEAKTIVGSAA